MGNRMNKDIKSYTDQQTETDIEFLDLLTKTIDMELIQAESKIKIP
jgi:hypothetical protein